MTDEPIGNPGILYLHAIAYGVDFDPRALLLHVVHHTAHESPRVVDRERGPALHFAHVVEIIGPLLAVREFEILDREEAILALSFLGDTQALGAFEEYLLVRLCGLIEVGR